MAKDAKGHGSNGRGGGGLSVPDQHQHRIAVDTVKNPLKGTFLGGMNAAEAEKLLTGKFGYSQAKVDALKGNDHPKSGAVPLHSATPTPKADAFYKNLESKQSGTTFPKHGYMPNDPGNRAGRKPTDV